MLSRDNYDVWAPTIKRELQGKDVWAFCDGTREEIEALDEDANATEVILHRHALKEHRAEKAATGAYLYNACNKQIQDRYLSDLDFTQPQQIWNRLKEKLQGNDADSRSRLLNKFMTLTRQKGQSMQQFAKKLQTIQSLLNPADAAATKFIDDKMILVQIYKNAGPDFRSLTTNLQTNSDLTLATVLKRYELAEEQMEQETPSESYDDSATALYTNNRSNSNPNAASGQNRASSTFSRPRQVYMPTCPDDWTGSGCWFHSATSHAAVDCDTLKSLQRQFLENGNISIDRAPKRKGYPPPGSVPSRRPVNSGDSTSSSTRGSNTSQSSTPTPNQVSSNKRPMCHLCNNSGHYTDKCPSLKDAVTALKRFRTTTASAAVAEASPELEAGEVPAI